jgi:26S proteasome regulatory subunit N12
LKIALTQAGLLVPNKEAKKEDLVLARDVLEVGAFWSIRAKDVKSFDRYIDLLRVFYTDLG